MKSNFSKSACTFICILILSHSRILAQSNAFLDISTIGPRTEKVALSDYHLLCYVSVQTGSDEEGDGSRQNPWKTMKYTLTRLDDCSSEKRCALLVAAGTYDRATIVMKGHVDLFGGYHPETWKRDIFEYATILDGVNARRVVKGADHARIDGFTIRCGLAKSHGGGILCYDASPEISNNIISDNFVLEPDDFDHHHIHQNGNHGGGIACLFNSIPLIRNSIIVNNRTSVGCGGGMAFYGLLRIPDAPETELTDNRLVGGLRAVVENNVIIGNVSGINDVHRTRSSSGGGISCAYEARPVIRNNVIADNIAGGRSDAGGVYCEYFSDPDIMGNWILGNVSDDDGGAIYTMRLGHPLIQGNIIAGNWTKGGGVGGIRLSKEGRARIIDNIIVHNQSGGGVQCVDSYGELLGNIIMHNNGGGALSYKTNFTYFTPSLVRDNIMRGNESEEIRINRDSSESIVIKNNNVEGGYQGADNYDADPALPDDGFVGEVLELRYDPNHFMTQIVPATSLKEGERLIGRIIRIGDRWSIIRRIVTDTIFVWGNLSTDKGDVKFEIIPSYRKKN